jgi:hypothetical protein
MNFLIGAPKEGDLSATLEPELSRPRAAGSEEDSAKDCSSRTSFWMSVLLATEQSSSLEA